MCGVGGGACLAVMLGDDLRATVGSAWPANRYVVRRLVRVADGWLATVLCGPWLDQQGDGQNGVPSD